jgi:superfamily II DNA or RNA helicase
VTVLGAAPDTAPEPGDLVRVRGQQWVVSALRRSHQPIDELAASTTPGRTLVTLTSVSDDDLGEELTVAWEIEPGREVLPSSRLPEVRVGEVDDPNRLGAFLDAVRWGTVASADTRTLQAPFRSGITIKDYQLVPVARALGMPRVNLLIADDVGLGKTIEAGLIIQEMLLRHRARRVIVVCPASLTGKWHDEMAQRFGLSFEVLDTARLKALRRSHGLEANPFGVFPRTIISLQWLRSPRIQRLLDEVLDGMDGGPAFFDLLVVDEAHHCAPPAPSRSKGYAVDSQQTKAVRRLGEHAGHRIFLSATPHNGYAESWQALLEMLDPTRFLRGAEPDAAVLAEVMVRRLKDTIVDAEGQPEFTSRSTRAVEVTYREDELRAHQLLADYTRARRRGQGSVGVRLDDLVTLLLKKRLFSSPAAFAKTLDQHAETLTRTGRASTPGRTVGDDELPEWLSEALAWDDEPDTETTDDEVEGELLDRAAGAGSLGAAHDDGPAAADALLAELQAWADRHAEPADAKALALMAELEAICRPAGRWNDERVIVFTEYVDTLRWLADTLTARGLGGEHLGLIYGGMDEKQRERLKVAFQAAPERDKLRILLATDAASEGIDLQRHCHRVINYDIPFNPNRLEQRIGRVDRLGQGQPVEVVHFVGAGWEQAAPGSYEADLEFLSRVAAKVANERRDLGSVNPVLAAAVEARMLGRPVLVDPTSVEPAASVAVLRAERDLRASIEGIRTQLDESVRRLHVTPANVRRVVDVALVLAGQPPLVDVTPAAGSPGYGAATGLIAPPVLRGGWERTVDGLADPYDGTLRPLTFDPAVAAGRDNVVVAHLEHPLVARCTRLLRSAIWGGRLPLHRVTAIRAPIGDVIDVGGVLVAAFARLVVVGADGSRLHEEVVLAGRELPASGRTRRVELDATRYATLRGHLEAALDPPTLNPTACDPAPNSVTSRVADAWEGLAVSLADDVARRAEAQVVALERSFERRLAGEIARTNATFDQLRVTLVAAVEGPGARQLSFDDLDLIERQQHQRDRRAWQDRLDRLDADRAAELDRLATRYAGLRPLVFPFAVVAAAPLTAGSGVTATPSAS